MEITKQTKFILAIALQISIILIIIIFKMAVLTNGTEVLLKVEPIDPQSLLRGNYLTLQYNISNLDRSLFNINQIKKGETVYVILKKNGEYWKAEKVEKDKPNTNGQIFIKGKIVSESLENKVEFPKEKIKDLKIKTEKLKGKAENQRENQREKVLNAFLQSRRHINKPSVRIIHIIYGIEDYYIPEGKGNGFVFWHKRVTAKIAVDENGRAIVKQIYVNGNPWP